MNPKAVIRALVWNKVNAAIVAAIFIAAIQFGMIIGQTAETPADFQFNESVKTMDWGDTLGGDDPNLAERVIRAPFGAIYRTSLQLAELSASLVYHTGLWLPAPVYTVLGRVVVITPLAYAGYDLLFTVWGEGS